MQRTEHRHCTHTKQESSRHQSFPNAGTAISGNPCADVFAKAVEPLLQAKQLAKARAERERKNGDDGAVPIKVSFYAVQISMSPMAVMIPLDTRSGRPFFARRPINPPATIAMLFTSVAIISENTFQIKQTGEDAIRHLRHASAPPKRYHHTTACCMDSTVFTMHAPPLQARLCCQG